MSRTFLPPLPNGNIALPQVQSNDFVGGPPSLVGDIHANMAPSDANSEGRAPSPFARVWQFRRNLNGDAGRHEQRRAVAAFRGLLALFALRDFYHLKLEVDVTPRLQEDPDLGPTAVSRLFEVHTVYLPQPAAQAQARFLFGERLVFFRLVEPPGYTDTVIAGYSPLTLFFPAARSLENSRALNSIFWYDRDARRWHDPTNPPEGTQPRLPQEARAHLAAWLDDLLATRVPGSQRLAALAGGGLAPADESFLTAQLRSWRQALGQATGDGSVQTRVATLPKSAQLLNVERTQGRPFQVPQLFDKVYHGSVLPSDSGNQNGVLVLTLDQVADPTHLIYGNIFGSPDLKERLKVSPVDGADLGQALGRPGEAPVPYLTLDLLFTAKLGRIEKGRNTVNPEWAALPLQDESPVLNGIYLLPFSPTILRYFSAQEIHGATQAKSNVAAAEVILQLNGMRVSRLYDLQRDIKTLDPSLDLRFFPYFRLDTLANEDLQLPFPEDRRYYARLRLSPDFDQLPMRWLSTDGTPLPNVVSYSQGNYDSPANPKLLPLGRQFFWRLPITTPPGAFEIEGHGLLLLTLRGSDHQGDTPHAWTVALDFGTTNSCVAVNKTGADGVDSAYRLPIFTTPLLNTWKTEFRGKSNSDEGASVLADFMFWRSASIDTLNVEEFFPTQVLTRNRLDVDRLPYPDGFDERNGLAFFPNVSLAALDPKGFINLIEEFDAMRTTDGIKPRFKLKRNLKWKDDRDGGGNALVWRTAFHQHLRLHMILAAAAENAYISRLVASYPKAFTPNEAGKYRKELEKIWGRASAASQPPQAAARPSPTTIETRSESAAAALALEIASGQEYFLLDMGGGTTDIAVFKDSTLEEECSLPLAGQVLERYVCASKGLREGIAQHFDDSFADGKKAFLAANQQPDHVYQTLFQGFLIKGEGLEALGTLRENRDRAVQGFFLSALFLYTGLAYFCGLWLAKRRQGVDGIAADERLQWLGNGSSFIRMFGVHDKSFEEVLVRMFNEAGHGKAKVSALRPDAKTDLPTIKWTRGSATSRKHNRYENDAKQVRQEI